jgi:transposase
MDKASTLVSGVMAPVRRRRWLKDEKRRVVEEALAPGASIARVARNHDVNANQLHTWRRLYERGLLQADGEVATLLPVRVVRGAPALPVVRLASDSSVSRQSQPSRRMRPAGVIQIETERGRIRIEGAADPAVLRVALECLIG